MATEAQVRVAFSTDHAELQVTSAPFSVPVNVNASGLSEVISHLLNLSPPQTFSFLVIDDAQLLHSSIENYLIEHHKSREAVLRLKFFPSTKGPEKTSSSPCPDWVSDISTSLQNLVFAACYDGTAQIKDALGNKLLTVCTGHKSAVKAISVCPTSRGGFRMVTASKDHTIGLWESDKFESAGNMKRNAQNSDKRGNDQDDQANERANLPATIPIVRTATGRHLKSVDAIAMASMNTFFSGSWDGTVKLWSWPGTREAEAVIPDEPAAAKRGRSSHGNDNGSSQSQAHDVDILPVATLIGHTNQVSCLTVLDQKSTAAAAIATNLDMQNSANSNAGRFVVSGSWDHSLRLWDVDRFVAVREITCGKVVTDVSCVGNNGQVFASSHPDNTIRLWDGRLDASGSVMQLSLKGHNQWISSLASSPWNQNELASGSYDGSLRTWDIRSNRPVHTMAEAHQGKILCVAWDGSESRRGIFTGGDDKQLNHFTV